MCSKQDTLNRTQARTPPLFFSGDWTSISTLALFSHREWRGKWRMDGMNGDCNKQKNLHPRHVCKYLNVLKYKYVKCINNIKHLAEIHRSRPNVIFFSFKACVEIFEWSFDCLLSYFKTSFTTVTPHPLRKDKAFTIKMSIHKIYKLFGAVPYFFCILKNIMPPKPCALLTLLVL